MRKLAIDQASKRLVKAREAVSRLETATLSSEIQSAWSDFISAVSTIYSKLEQGAKGNAKSTAWWGKLKHERRKDPLLSYLRYARNVDEHGLAHLMDGQDWSIEVRYDQGAELEGYIEATASDQPPSADSFHVTRYTGRNAPTVIVDGPKLELLAVTDERFGDSVPPPETHLGQPVAEPSPIVVARLGLAYLVGKVEEASLLIEEERR